MHRRDLHDLCTAGCLVLGVDYRGCGETDGGGNENQWALLRGINLGRPLLGWRTWDVIRTVDYLLTRDDVRPDAIALWGEREASLLALYAAALDERIAATVCLGPLASYLGDQGFTQPYWWFPRNILQVADICDLARIVSPRSLLLANSCDGAGNELSSEALGQLFGELAGLTLFSGPNEDFERQARHLILGAC